MARRSEVEHAARAGFTVHTGGSIDDEHGGWARLFRGVGESLVRDREEHRAVQNVVGGLSERYRRLLAQEGRTRYIHLNNARVLAPGVGPPLDGGVHWRGRHGAWPDHRSGNVTSRLAIDFLAACAAPLPSSTPIPTPW